MNDPKSERVVAARMKLMARFQAAQKAASSRGNLAPQGSGPSNRHGMPQLPIGQIRSEKWPVLDLGISPTVSSGTFSLQIDGAVERPTKLNYAALLELNVVTDLSDFHCVTTWSKMDLAWRGVRLADVLALVDVHEAATHLMCHASDGYTTNLALSEALKPDVLLVTEVDGAPLSHNHGGPVRMITPQLYAWKGAKWISRLELMTTDRPGYWEERGYSMTADPWRDDRYR